MIDRAEVERRMRVGGCYIQTLAISSIDCVPVERTVSVALALMRETRLEQAELDDKIFRTSRDSLVALATMRAERDRLRRDVKEKRG